MATPYLNLYMNNPTAGGTDGTTVSTDGSFTAPISFTLDATQNESKITKCAVRMESGFVSVGTTTISAENDTNSRVKLCWTEDGEFTDSISTDEQITNANKLFYVKASAADTETPQTDRSISLKVHFTVATV